ncbi:MAG: hypothetical protein K8S98_08320 [Planctomycetes bacterium]|nr:hypothetical protein [Planctomycetota bacterium]
MTAPPRALKAFGIVLAVLVGLELGTRVWLRITATPWDFDAAKAEIEGLLGAHDAPAGSAPPTNDGAAVDATRTETLHPYLGVDLVASRERLRRELEATQRDDGFDVFVLGGSTATDFVGAGAETLAALLTNASGLSSGPVRVWGEGRSTFKEPQQANELAYALTFGVRPDLVIVIDGFNDVALAVENGWEGTHPLYPWAPRWVALAGSGMRDPKTLDRMLALRERRARTARLARFELASGVMNSALLGSLGLRKLHALDREADAAFEELNAGLRAADATHAERGPDHATDHARILDAAVTAWSEGAFSMWSLCRDRGIAYLHVLEPTLHDEGSKPATAEELAHGQVPPAWSEAVRLGYPRLREAGAALAERGVPFLDASRIFADVNEPLYYDGSRFAEAGQRLLGDALGRRVVADFAARRGAK